MPPTRIAYVAALAVPHAGVLRKILGQAAALDRLGADDVDVYVVNVERNGRDGRLRYVRVDGRSLVGRVDLGLRPFRLIERSIRCDEYNLVYLRYPTAGPDAIGFVRRHAVVTEHNTIETRERFSSVRSDLPVMLRAYRAGAGVMEHLFGPPTLSRCRGMVGVTDEIRDFEARRAGDGVPTITVPNGIAVDDVPHTRFCALDGSSLRIAFLTGRASPWHGTQRLLNSLAAYRGSMSIECHLVGPLSSRSRLPRLPNSVSVRLHGPLQGRALDDLLRQMHLGVGTLALHRKGLTEACPLKVREYTARGLPFVLGHRDPDLTEVDPQHPFFLSVTNDDSVVDFERVVDFADRATQAERQISLSTVMREYARTHMDWSLKMDALMRFLRPLSG